ncbi:MAG: hypothetical protein RL499_454 [Actinomycetota bacterium]
MQSAWEAALGDEIAGLHPRIRAYVRAIPPGSVGRGQGVFTEAGSRSAVMRPVLAVMARWGIVFPERGRQVAFSIENRADAHGAVHARRTLRFARRERVMVDRVREHRGLVVDALGTGGRLEAALRVSAHDGALMARSGAVRVRIAGVWWSIPAAVRPRVDLVERWDDEAQQQHVNVRVSMPVLGDIYGYHGWFDYAVVAESTVEPPERGDRSADSERLGEWQYQRNRPGGASSWPRHRGLSARHS